MVPALDMLEIGVDQRPAQLTRAFPVPLRCHPIHVLLQRLQGVSHRNGAFAHVKKGMIVFRIADAHHVMGGETELEKRRSQSGRLVHAGWQNHDSPFVEDDLKLEAEIANDFHSSRFMRFPCGYDDSSYRDSFRTTAHQLAGKFLGRRLGQELLLTCGRTVEEGAVLGHDPVKQVEPGANKNKVVEFSSSDQNHFAPGLTDLFQGSDRALTELSIMGNGPVIIAGKGVISHNFIVIRGQTCEEKIGSPPGQMDVGHHAAGAAATYPLEEWERRFHNFNVLLDGFPLVRPEYKPG